MAKSSAFQRACGEARERAERYMRGDREAFDDARAEHMVGLYALLHTRVYEVGPGELADAKVFLGARSAAGKMLRDEFGGRQLPMVEFIQWVWSRERQRERQRRGVDCQYRIGWRLQFQSRVLVTDYRVALAREGRRTTG